jgi:hypothetical protein
VETHASWNKFVSRSFFLAMFTMVFSTLALFTDHLDSAHYAMIVTGIGAAYYGKRWADTRAISS